MRRIKHTFIGTVWLQLGLRKTVDVSPCNLIYDWGKCRLVLYVHILGCQSEPTSKDSTKRTRWSRPLLDALFSGGLYCAIQLQPRAKVGLAAAAAPRPLALAAGDVLQHIAFLASLR